jgi:hypothetical protein
MKKISKNVDSHLKNGVNKKVNSASQMESNSTPDIEALIPCIKSQEDVFLFYFLIIYQGLYKIGNDTENPQVKDLLSSFSKLMDSKCHYFLDTDGSLCFKFKGNKELEKTTEGTLVALLGVFAYLRINLEYLEQQNPELEGLNMLFTGLYPDVMDAYRTITNTFGFDGTVKLGFDKSDPDKLLTQLNSMKIEHWKNDVIKLPQVPTTENVCEEVTISNSDEKYEAKVRERIKNPNYITSINKSSQRKNRQKSGKILNNTK